MEETHDLFVYYSNIDNLVLECVCGWRMDEPPYVPGGIAGWRVAELVSFANSHITAALA